MGADLLIYTLAWKTDTELDWDAGTRWLDELTVERFRQIIDDGEYVGWDVEFLLQDKDVEVDEDRWAEAFEQARDTLRGLLADLKDRFNKDAFYRDVTDLKFGDWWLMIAGGTSFGEIPGETCEVIDDLTNDWSPLGAQLLEAVGFSWPAEGQRSSNAFKIRFQPKEET